MTKQMLTAMAAGLVLAAATPAIAQQGGSTVTTATTQGPMLSFSVSEDVRSRPDQATVGAGVTTTAPTAVEAMRLNATAMDKLIAAAKARGIKAEDIQTSGISLSPEQAQQAIRAGVIEGLARRAQCPPLATATPVVVDLQTTSPGLADLFCQWPTLERVDGNLLRFSAPEIESAVRMLNCLSAMSSMLR